ncbi:MAG TPA: glycosyltransferase [Candidatus Kapabacteria bacterium]|nr:glycosyltransferase [Candidatus Kapabacteria bacterium]
MPEPAPNNLQALNYGGLPVLHLFHQFQSIGGVESILRFHHEYDPKVGVNSDFVIYMENSSEPEDRTHCLNIQPNDSIRTIGRKLQNVTALRKERIALYHLTWGARYFCPHDHSKRRILVVHTKDKSVERFLRRDIGFFDGILCINEQIQGMVRNVLPDFPIERMAIVNCPIRPLGESGSRPKGSKLRLGYVGRLQTLHKRIDRIPAFCAELKKQGVDFDLEIIGDGPERDLLKQAALEHSFHFHGVLRGEDYWAAIRNLDALVLFSDIEGTPVSLIEALSQGVIPIYPKINSGGDPYVSSINPDLLYAPGDMRAAAAIAKYLSLSPPDTIAKLGDRCRESVKSHSLENYFTATYDFVQSISQTPRISSSSPGAGMALFQFVTLAQHATIRRMLSKKTYSRA